MDLVLSPHQHSLQAAAREYASAGLASGDLQRTLHELGLHRCFGSGEPWKDRPEGARLVACLVLEELAFVDAAVAFGAFSQWVLFPGFLDGMGTETQRKRWLDRILSCDEIGAACMPAGWNVLERQAGSDANGRDPCFREGDRRERLARASSASAPQGHASRMGALEHADETESGVWARREGPGWILDGRAPPAILGRIAAAFLVIASQEEESDGATRAGSVVCLVESDRRGSRVEPLGGTGLGGEMASLVLSACSVTKEDQLEEPSSGTLESLRSWHGLGLAATALGLARAGLGRAMAPLRRGSRQGAPRQSVGFRVADAATDLDAARLLTHRAAARLDAGHGANALWRVATLQATRAAIRSCALSSELLHDLALSEEGQAETLYRDARRVSFLAGSDDRQRLSICAEVLRA